MKIKSLHLKSPNPHEQATFYGDVLGLPIEKEGESIRVKIGRSFLHFEKGDLPARCHFAFDIPENRFQEAANWLKKRSEILRDERGDWHFQSENWNADMLYFHDADKHVVEFIARHNQPTSTLLPFDANGLVAISEVGMVTSQVMQTVSLLKHELGLKVWRGAGSETFSAVGDEEGLFIVTLEGRPWRPELIGAKPSPLRVEVEGLGKDYQFEDLPYQIESLKTPV